MTLTSLRKRPSRSSQRVRTAWSRRPTFSSKPMPCYAPGGYVYLLVADGKATLATVLLLSFERARTCLEKASALLGERLHLDMRHVRRFGGIGQFRVPSRPGCDFSSPGEAGGFQDLLFGFGIRLALTTGHLAAPSLLGGGGCQSQRREVEEILRASTCNRLLF